MPTTLSALDIIKRSMKQLGVLRQGEEPTANEAADALEALNDMIDDWGTQRLTMLVQDRTEKALAASTTSYTIGLGGDINISRPIVIENAGVIIDASANPKVERPIQIFTDDEWAAVRIKGLTSTLIQGIYYDYDYDNTTGLALIYPWPVPSVGTTKLVIYSPRPLSEFPDLTTQYGFAPSYRRAMVYNGAVAMAGVFGFPVPPAVAALAVETKGNLKRANIRYQEMAPPPGTPGVIGGNGRPWDWRTGGY